jgi:hypothetical protein
LVLPDNTNPYEESFVPDSPPKLLYQMMPSNPCAGVVDARRPEFFEMVQVVVSPQFGLASGPLGGNSAHEMVFTLYL